MALFFFDSDIKRNFSHIEVKQARTANDSDTYKAGDIVETWDHVFRWDHDCIPNAQMVQWRFRGDKLADSALTTIMGPGGNAGGTDLLMRLEAATKTTTPSSFEIDAFQRHNHTIDDSDFRFNREQIARGQAVFYRYAPHILASLLQFSLAAGFSSPRISRVLNLGSYLVPPMSSTPDGEAPRISSASNDRTYMRLMETTQFVIDCMSKDAMEVGGTGWKAAIRVRLLHANIRQKILDKVRADWKNKGYAPYDETRDGVPISQEDYAATLCAFATGPLLALIKVGITPSEQECEDYTALWKVIGYYLGVEEDILQKHYSSWHQATRMTACAFVNIFAGESDPPPPTYLPLEKLIPEQDQVIHVKFKSYNDDPYTSSATLAVLFSVCNRWPLPFTLVDHSAASRNLIGPSLSDWLSIPKTNWIEWFKLQIGYGILNIPPKFAQIYRRGWDARRRAAMQESVEASIIVALKDRITKFRPRSLDAFEPRREPDEFNVNPSGLVFGAVWRWGVLYAEMGVVLLLLGPLVPLYAAKVSFDIAVRGIARAREKVK